MKSKSLPDFIIGGAMKSGTSTLRHLLASHENVFIPSREVHFFSLDEFEQHPPFFRGTDGRWVHHDYEARLDSYQAWYERFFEPAAAHQRVGEDSTVYLASERAPRRIRALLPEVKLIFLLRDPVARAYSHYWHAVRMGRATYGFEDQLQYAPGTLLQRGYYRRQLEGHLSVFPADQVKIILFEQFVENLQDTLNEVCQFIGVEPTLDVEVLPTRFNQARTPRWPRLQVAANWLFRQAATHRYDGYLPGSERLVRRKTGRPGWLLKKAVDRVNLAARPYPPMARTTRDFLRHLYARENEGLSELIGRDVAAYWPYMRLRD